MTPIFCHSLIDFVQICIRIYKYTIEIHTGLFLKQQGKVLQYVFFKY